MRMNRTTPQFEQSISLTLSKRLDTVFANTMSTREYGVGTLANTAEASQATPQAWGRDHVMVKVLHDLPMPFKDKKTFIPLDLLKKGGLVGFDSETDLFDPFGKEQLGIQPRLIGPASHELTRTCLVTLFVQVFGIAAVKIVFDKRTL